MKNKKLFFLYLCFILIFLFFCCFFYYGNDYYWHVKIGEYIFNHKKIPYIDLFSWYGSVNKLKWISHEWFSEVIIFLFSKLFKYGAFIYVISLITMISTFIFYTNRKSFKQKSFATIIWGFFGGIIFLAKLLPRPHLISYLLFAITIYLAYDLYKNEKSKKIYLCFFIAILWSNCHGGSSNLSYLIYGLFFIICFIPINKFKIINNSKTTLQKRKYFYAIILSIFGILINWHGLTMLIYPYQNMAYTKMISCISEWQSLNIFRIDGIAYIIFIIIILITIISSKKIQLIDITLFLIFTILGVKSVKFMPYLYISSSYYIFNYIKDKKLTINPIIIFPFVCIFVIFAFLHKLSLKDNNAISKDIINYLQENNNYVLYNSYSTGGYLIYNDIKPFIDGRADLYINTIFSDSCDIEQGKPTILNKYNFDTFLVIKNSASYKYLKKHKKYQLILHDKEYYLFKLKTE